MRRHHAYDVFLPLVIVSLGVLGGPASVEAQADRAAQFAGGGQPVATIPPHDTTDVPGAEPATDFSPVVVTGTRTQRSVTTSMSPVNVVTAAELASTGRASLKDALIALDATYTNSPVYAGQLGFAGKAATLRGLAANETLVLINGKRRHAQALPYVSGSSAGQSPTDLDLIPASAVDHIEILRDGAAAQYGSDAIAGVINIILKSNVGGDAVASYGQYGATVGPLGDYGKTENVGVDQGFKLGQDGFINFSVDLLNAEDTNYGGYVPLTTKLYPSIDGAPDPRETGDSRYRQVSGQPARKKIAASYDAELPITDAVTLYSFSTYAYRTSAGYTWFRPDASAQNIPQISPNGYMPLLVTHDSDYQVLAGIKGRDLVGWEWDLSSSVGTDTVHAFNDDTENPSLGPDSPTNFYLGSLIATEFVEDFDLKRQFGTPLFARPLNAATGLEFRDDSFKVGAGSPLSYADGGYVFPAGGNNAGTMPNPGASGVSGFSPSNAGAHSRHDTAFYIDLDQSITERWEVGLAGRDEYYSDVHNTPSGKFSTRFQVSDAIAVRGTVNSGFHAPTLQQEYFSSTTSSYVTVAGAQRPLLAVSAPATDPQALLLGGGPLKAETSLNESVGIVLTPLSNFDLTLDAYQIKITNQIVPVTLSTSAIGGAAVRSILESGGFAGNLADQYSIAYERNVADTEVRGLDLSIHYTSVVGDWGRVKWTLQSNESAHTITESHALSPALTAAGVPAIDRLTEGYLTVIYPKNVTRASATWALGRFELTPRLTHYSQVRNLSDNGAGADEVVNAAYILDADAVWHITDTLKLAIGGTNITGKRPNTLSPGAQKYSGFPQVNPNYSTVSPYGDDGGFYYLNVKLDW